MANIFNFIIPLLLLFSSCALVNSLTPKAEISMNQGDTIEHIIKQMGKPDSYELVGSFEFLKYIDHDLIIHFNYGGFVQKFIIDSYEDNAYNLEVDSISSNSPITKIKILPNMEKISEGDLLFQLVKSYVEILLQGNKISYTDKEKDADIILGISYGIGDPQIDVRTISRTIWGYDTDKTVYSTITNNHGSTQVTSTIPGKGIYALGTNTETIKDVTFIRYLSLKGIDTKSFLKNNKIVERFNVIATSKGPSDDFRLILPSLIAGSWAWFNKDSKLKQYYSIGESSLKVWILRNWNLINNPPVSPHASTP